MGNSPPPPQPEQKQETKHIETKPKPTKINKQPKQKEKEPVEPSHSDANILDKDIKLPFQALNQHLKQIFQGEKNQIFDQFKTKFLARVSRKEIKILFKGSQYGSLSNESEVSMFSDRQIMRLQKDSEIDYQLYEKTLEMRLKKVFVSLIGETYIYSEAQLEEIREKTKNNFHEAELQFLGQLSGKTTIWSSLNLSAAEIKTKIITFLDAEGVDSSQFHFLDEKLP